MPNDVTFNWYSPTAASVLEIVRRLCLERDDEINEFMLAGANLGFGILKDERARNFADLVEWQCRFCVSNAPICSSPDDIDEDNIGYAGYFAAIGICLDAISREDWKTLETMAYSAGIIWGELSAKNNWQVDAIRGSKVAGGLQNAAHITNSRHHEPRRVRIARMRDLVRSGMKVANAAAQCETEGLGKADAIRQQWYRHGKV